LSTLFLIRHGQASFGQANYDKLSEAGERQSSLFGEYFAKKGIVFDAVYTGTLERQTHTAELTKTAYEEAGLSWPDQITMPEFNEYDAQKILTGSVPTVIKDHPELVELFKELSPDGKEPDLVNNKKTFQRILGAVMEMWVDGRFDDTSMESWKDFTARANKGIDRIIGENISGKTVALFTSGGVISAVTQRAVKSPDMTAMELGWLIINTSYTKFRYSKDKFSLATFNETSHITDKSLITLR
jgi:broad specificity phosphatase PhoE